MPGKKVLLRKQAETVRERAEKLTAKQEKVGKQKPSKVNRPLSILRSVTKKRADTRTNAKKTKRFRIIPRFFPEAWSELRLVTWPTKKEAARLTGAVIIFAAFFAVFIQLLDLVFNKLVKEIFLK
jgi:preprotein translocase subunit SecE